jgi:hypothetical protein
MNRTLKVSLFSAAMLAVSAVSGFAQANNKVAVKVPFEFVAGTTTFPAGNYEFSQDQNGILYISSAETHKSAMILTNAEPVALFTATAPAVKFDKEEGVYSLSEVSLADAMGRRVIKIDHASGTAAMVSKAGLTNGAAKGLKK